MEKTRVLIVDDNKELVKMIKEYFSAHAEIKITLEANDGEQAVEIALKRKPNLVLLDIMLPKMDGFEVIRTLRNDRIDTPVLMLTAKGTMSDKVSGLNYGADDYMTKPFNVEELLARVGALTRRKGSVIVNTLTYKDISLNVNSAMLTCKNESVQLSRKEFEVLKVFLYNPTMTVTNDILINKVWGMDSEATYNNVEVYISFLRKKLKYLNSDVSIKKIHKLGYRLEDKEC